MARHIDLRSNWERYTNKLAAVTEDVGRLLECAFNYSPSETLDEELVLQMIPLLR